jgi:hypothetical protein
MDNLEKSLPAHHHQICQNGDPETAATMAQLGVAPYHKDQHVLTTKKYTTNLIVDKGKRQRE